ncbi:MAG: family 43 glycosylhydrolase [Alistipes sp.]|nr:family 43 glycosylhydrolase [Alistipes sp.]
MNKKLITMLSAAMLLGQLFAQTPTYRNPILGGDYPDPTIMREGEDYYMTHSAFDYQPGLTVFHSRDLVHWEPISCALNTYLGSIWAPDISKHGDKYYIYFTVALKNGRKNYVTYASSPYGPWSEPIDLHIANIDPCHVVGEDGSRWLFMSAGKRARLTDDGLAIVPGTEETVYEGWQYPEEWLTEGFCLEGPKLRRIGEYYYYLNAEGGTAGPPTSHMITMARSKSINGPWENAPCNPLVHTYNNSDRWWSKGHGSLIDTPDGRWYVVYHSYENGFYNLGRQTLLEPVEMTPDGWFRTCPDTDIEGETAMPLPVDGSIGPRHDKVGLFRTGLEWKFYKAHDPSRVQVEDGALTLKSAGKDMPDSPPMLFVAGVHSYEIEARITLIGDVTAGLTLFYNDRFFMGTGFNRMRRVRHRMGEERGTGRHEVEAPQTMRLRLRNDRHVVTGQYSYDDGATWHRETWGMDISGYHHNTLYEFQSVLPGVYVYGDGQARFEEFKFKVLE